ncbi:MAG TPA: Gfo/Idh/MocA family oxidoreductase [Bryobacteraceae bacterium]|nr:Gfo/Idh/MocA family oxidoreductase [Bryobacteraceae bacterium]
MDTLLSRRSLMAGVALATQAPAPFRLPRRIRLAMIGLEGHTSEILGPLPRLPDVDLVAASDPSARALARLSKLPNASGMRTYQDWRQLLDREKNLDMVATCGPNGERPAILLACAERKLHIVSEKPLAIERPDLERIKKAVAAAGVRLTMLLPMRFSAPYLALKQVVDSGQIGEVAQIGGQKSYRLGERPNWMRRRAEFGGTIPYIGIHLVDLMRYTSGREMVETAAFQSRVGFPDLGDMENTTSTIYRLDNGGTASMRLDYLRPDAAPTHGDDRLRLAGTEGVVELQPATGVTLVTRKEKPRPITDLPQDRSLFLDFLASVYHGKTAELSLKDIYRVNEIVLASRQAAEEGRVVKI